MANTFYKYCRRLIDNLEAKRKTVISVDKLVNEAVDNVDYEQMPKEELVRRCANAEAHCALYISGYRSVIRGMGYFVNANNIGKPEFVQSLLEGAKTSKDEKAIIYNELMKKSVEQFPEYSQQVMQWDDDDNVSIVEGLTKEDVIRMLEEDAE